MQHLNLTLNSLPLFQAVSGTRKNILVFTPASASVLHFVTFPLRTLFTQKLLKAVIWKWDSFKFQTPLEFKALFPLATHASLIFNNVGETVFLDFGFSFFLVVFIPT